jgi:hypothetical protein
LGEENQVCSNKGPGPLQRGDNHKNGVMSFKNLIQNHWANFKQTWAQIIVGGRGFKFVQMKGIAPLQGEI